MGYKLAQARVLCGLGAKNGYSIPPPPDEIEHSNRYCKTRLKHHLKQLFKWFKKIRFQWFILTAFCRPEGHWYENLP